MMSNSKVCVHCRRNLKARVSEDIAFHAHWVGDCFMFDVVLLIPDDSAVHDSREYVTTVLYREAYKKV